MKKLTLNTLFYLCISFCFIQFSCSEDDTIASDSSSQNSGVDQGSSVNRDFIGRVLDDNNNPLSNASVSIGTSTAFTDVNGRFIIDDATVSNRQALISISKSGYLKSIKTVVPTTGTNSISVMMIPENVVASINSGSSSTVGLTNGTQVTFDGDFKTDAGIEYTGLVDVLMYHLDPSNVNIEEIMPGNLQALNSSNQERVLETYGMLNVELRGSSGEHLNIADNSMAEIEIPIDPAQINAPSTIPLWSFNETSGLWVEDGIAVKQGNKYVGQVSHFSWWNCDAQFPTVSLCLNVVDSSNSPLSNVRVELWRANAIYPRNGYSNGNGEICGLIPANESLTLIAFDQCGSQVHTQTVGPFSTDTNLGQVILPTINVAVITGNLVDCNNTNVTNGYITLEYGNQLSDIYITNGAFSFNVIECASQQTFTLEGVDFSSFQTTGMLNYSISNTNVGNIITCNTVTEFISIEIDNDPAEYYLTNISTGQSSPGFLNISANGATNDFFYVGGSNTNLGTYDSSVYTIESSVMNIDYNQPINISYNLNSYGNVGEYIDMNFSGTYTDNTGNLKSVVGVAHVIRD
jgi:hypothetical protein